MTTPWQWSQVITKESMRHAVKTSSFATATSTSAWEWQSVRFLPGTTTTVWGMCSFWTSKCTTHSRPFMSRQILERLLQCYQVLEVKLLTSSTTALRSTTLSGGRSTSVPSNRTSLVRLTPLAVWFILWEMYHATLSHLLIWMVSYCETSTFRVTYWFQASSAATRRTLARVSLCRTWMMIACGRSSGSATSLKTFRVMSWILSLSPPTLTLTASLPTKKAKSAWLA